MTMGRQKSDDEGKKEQKYRTGKKKFLKPSRRLNIIVHEHTLLEECVGRIVFLSFNLKQIPSMSE
jgi:hypothetical protein